MMKKELFLNEESSRLHTYLQLMRTFTEPSLFTTAMVKSISVSAVAMKLSLFTRLL